MNTKKFFEKALEAGITSSQLVISQSTATSFSLFHREIDSYSVEGNQGVIASGIFDGKYGTASSDRIDDSIIDFLIKGIIDSAEISERNDCLDIFPGSPKYKKKRFYNEELEKTPMVEKISMMKDVEDSLFKIGDDVDDVQEVAYCEVYATRLFCNSYGLKLKDKKNYYSIYASIALKRGEETKTSGYSFLETDLKKFDKEKFVNKIYSEGEKKFGGTQCPAGKYPTLLDRDVFEDLVSYFMAANSSIAVQKNSSFLAGLEGEKVASSKLTIDDVPLKKGPAYEYFDGEGVAQHNQKIVNHGVLITHFYNRETAKKANRETTGHAVGGLGKLGVSATNIVVRPSKLSKEELIKDVKLGVYITEVAGLGTGINNASGDFSCQAEGFMIRDGKIAEPLDLITLAGNLLKMFKDIKNVDNNLDDCLVGTCTPDVLIKSMSIGGKN